MTQTEYNFAPGNTREAGVKLAEGEWLCFADHDDEFIPDTLKRIKATIEKYGEKYCAIANFLEVDPNTGRTLSEMAVGTFIPTRTFAQWLDYLHHDIKPKVTMSDSLWKEQK